MTVPTIVAGFNRATLPVNQQFAYDILTNVTTDQLAGLKAKLAEGSPTVVGPATVAALASFCSKNHIDLSPNGVSDFKSSRGLGDTGASHGVIGPQTAAAYASAILSMGVSHVIQGVPYFTQWDNQLHPGGSCNCTSLSMCLEYFGKPIHTPHARTADNLLAECDARGLNHGDPNVMANLAREHGMGDNFTAAGSWGRVKDSISQNLPVIVHGWFTEAGHIIVLTGFDEAKGHWMANDPAGQYPHYSEPGWLPGSSVWYDNDLLVSKVGSEGDMWVHYLQRP